MNTQTVIPFQIRKNYSARKRLHYCENEAESSLSNKPIQDNKNTGSPKKMCISSQKLLSPTNRLNHTSVKHNSPQKHTSKNRKENIRKKETTVLVCSKPDVSVYKQAKLALHTSQPEKLPCREEQIKIMTHFLEKHLQKKVPGSLYISGAPGTGKTACLLKILSTLKITNSIFINCMSVKQPQAIFDKILNKLQLDSTLKSSKSVVKSLERKLLSSGPMVLLILDEVDQLETKSQDVLYTLFDLASSTDSRLVLIGIANALDLTDRVLPRLQIRPSFKPQLLHFPPYTKDEIQYILEARLQQIEDYQHLFDTMALQFCARKVAAVAGDVRKALDVCRRAVEIVETDVRRQQILRPSLLDICNSPKKNGLEPAIKKIGLQHISRIMSEAYESKAAIESTAENPMPLQQKLLICTLILLTKEIKRQEVSFGKLHETYCCVCKRCQVTRIDQSEFHSLCSLVETRGIITVKKAKETRLMKITLKLEAEEVEAAIQDKTLLSSILKGGIPK